MTSVWSETGRLPAFESLNKDVDTDVLIIGGGIAGILCAYMLKQAGVSYVLLEAKRICSGITENTTAKITSQHGLIYARLMKRFGIEKTRMYIEANETGLEKFRSLCRGIDCDFEEKDSFVYSLDNPEKIQKELNALNKIGYNAAFADNLPLPFSTAGAVTFSSQAQFHPLKFIAAIAKGLNIYENSPVLELQHSGLDRRKNRAVTDKVSVAADKIIVATHFPFINKHGSYFLKMFQNRSYVTALTNAPQIDGMYVDEAEKGLSFRRYKDLLLLGGGSHRTGKHGGGWQELLDFRTRNFADAKEEYRWAAQDCMTLDEVPYIGRYSANTQGLYVATGFNKWGMTSSMAAAMILTDMIMDKKNEFEAVFSPSRTILRPQLFVNSIESITNLLTFSRKRCPHLGCALKWNPQEHTWDCPCHGSRFTEDGKLIDNPATGDLKSSKAAKRF